MCDTIWRALKDASERKWVVPEILFSRIEHSWHTRAEDGCRLKRKSFHVVCKSKTGS